MPWVSVLIERIHGSGESEFGVILTPDNVESRLAKMEAQRMWYRQRYPAEVSRLQELYDIALATD